MPPRGPERQHGVQTSMQCILNIGWLPTVIVADTSSKAAKTTGKRRPCTAAATDGPGHPRASLGPATASVIGPLPWALGAVSRRRSCLWGLGEEFVSARRGLSRLPARPAAWRGTRPLAEMLRRRRPVASGGKIGDPRLAARRRNRRRRPGPAAVGQPRMEVQARPILSP